MDVRRIVDAGPLVAWLNASDQWHRWSATTLAQGRGPLHTTEIVLGEACHHLGGNSAPMHALLEWVRQGAVVLHPLWPRHLKRTQELMLKFERMDAADASLVVLSEFFPRAAIITVDARDFRVYRRFRRESLPVIAPEPG
jgi:predicted nucleic acid-binding protein